MRSHRALVWSAVLAVLVVAAAGIAGTTHFAGPRWLPNLTITRHAQAPRKLSLPSSKTRPTISAPHHAGKFALGPVVLWTVIGIAIIGVAMLLWRWWARRPLGAATTRHSVVATAMTEIPTDPDPDPEPDTPALRTGIELALRVLDEPRPPADLIVRAWLGLQETAEESGIVRRPAETPTEFTSRIMNRAVADDRAIRTLLRLYLRTRFGDHPVTTADVEAARAALEELVRTWPTPDSLVGTGPR